MPDHDGTKPDQEMSKLFWQAFLARNQSIIVDLMYGQLKSTVKCTQCGNISITFDPYLSLPLPISRPSYFQCALVPYELFRPITNGGGDSDESDEDYKTAGSMVRVPHPVMKFEISPTTTVYQLKKDVIE